MKKATSGTWSISPETYNVGQLVKKLFQNPVGLSCIIYHVLQCPMVGWLFWVWRPFETVFQPISGHLPERGRKRRERIEESKNVQTTPTRTYCKRNRPLPYYHPNCRTPRHWKFTQGHRTTRPRSNVLCIGWQILIYLNPTTFRKRQNYI